MGLLRAAVPRGRPRPRAAAGDRDPRRAGSRRRPPEARRVLDAGTGQRHHRDHVPARAARGPRRVALDISFDALALARQNARAPRRPAAPVAPRLGLAHGARTDRVRPRALEPARIWRSERRRTCRRPCATTTRAGPSSPATTAWRRSGSSSPPCRRTCEPGGLLVFEIGFGQAEAVRSEILTRPVWRFLRIEPDLEGIPRICVARLESPAERVNRIRKPWTSS